MAQRFITSDGASLTIPGGYASFRVVTNNSGLAANGILMIVGESTQGPDFSLETADLEQAVSFGPDQLADVRFKYGSGPLVDAYKAAIAPANDPDIVGSFNRAVLIKTNVSGRASSTLLHPDTSPYAVLADKSYGKNGNMLYYTITANPAEVKPTTGSFLLASPIADTDISFRVNGGASLPVTLGAGDLPPDMVDAIDDLTGVECSGGDDREVLPSVAAGNLAVSVSSYTATITYDDNWDSNPTVGDMLYIPTGSAIAGLDDANCGSYVVTSVTNNTIIAVKLRDASGDPDDRTAPVAVTSTPMADDSDFQCFAPVVITLENDDPIDGVGKTLEINDLASDDGLLSYIAFELNTTNVVEWISVEDTPTQIVSASEYRAELSVNRQLDGVSEDVRAGGEIALLLGYEGDTCSVTVSSTELTTTQSGGAGNDLDITLADFPTLSDLAAYINSQTGYSCSVGNPTIGQLPTDSLDYGTFTAATTFGNKTLRLKIDAYRFFQKVGESAVVQLGLTTPARANAGLPAITANTYLSGGSKGGTSDAQFQLAVDALEGVAGNFLVPCFSQDAADDILESLTDSSSTYTIDAINAYCRTHVLKMSTLKKRRNRQAFLSKKDTFANCRDAASNIASFRCSMTFQDVKNVADSGVVQYQSWMGAAVAAGMQAAAFSKGIVFKTANISGALQAAGDFNDQNDTNMEDALNAGLLPLKRRSTGGFYFVSDQTTYSRDSNFVFNSIQAVYVADIIALSSAQRMENAFVGQSVADITAPVALSYFEGIMADFLRLKLIAPSEGAEKGYKNASIRINGGTMLVSADVYLAGLIYFVSISFLVQQVQQSATQAQ